MLNDFSFAEKICRRCDHIRSPILFHHFQILTYSRDPWKQSEYFNAAIFQSNLTFSGENYGFFSKPNTNYAMSVIKLESRLGEAKKKNWFFSSKNGRRVIFSVEKHYVNFEKHPCYRGGLLRYLARRIKMLYVCKKYGWF